jgi:hypothetical protein
LIVQIATSVVIAVSAGILVGASAAIAAGASAGATSDEGIFLDLTRARQNVAETPMRRSLPPADPQVRTQEPPGRRTDFILLGVAIAGETRLALVQVAAGRSGRPELLRVGAFLEGYQLIDIDEHQVTLVEGQRGDRVVLQLQIGGRTVGDGSSEATGRVERAKPANSGELGWREVVRAKKDRRARQTQRDAEEKARALMGERGVSIDPR